jgi:hypothetical protein
MKEEGRRKKEEGRRKKEEGGLYMWIAIPLNEGRRKKEEGRRKKEVYICGLPRIILQFPTFANCAEWHKAHLAVVTLHDFLAQLIHLA